MQIKCLSQKNKVGQTDAKKVVDHNRDEQRVRKLASLIRDQDISGIVEHLEQNQKGGYTSAYCDRLQSTRGLSKSI
jgi:hypothetical protein